MAKKSRQTPIETPKDLAQGVADRAPFDRAKSRKVSSNATRAADRLIEEMDDVLKRLERRG